MENNFSGDIGSAFVLELDLLRPGVLFGIFTVKIVVRKFCATHFYGFFDEDLIICQMLRNIGKTSYLQETHSYADKNLEDSINRHNTPSNYDERVN